jgi:hypothetical protein
MNRRPSHTTGARILLGSLLLAGGISLGHAGNPILVNSVSGPVTWPDGVVPFNTDLGPLGILDNATATGMVRDGFATWQSLPVSISVRDQGPILLSGAPVDVTFDNFQSILFHLDGQSPVIFDHDGRIMDALGVGGFAGFSFNEYFTPDGQHFLERAILLDGRDIDADGPFTPVGWQGLVNHEEGHHLGLAHSVVNAQAYFFGDPIIGLPPPPASSLETMYPFLLLNDPSQASPHKDDISMLSLLYPVVNILPGGGAIRGTIRNADLVSPQRGVNVTARNLADPYNDAVASISGAFEFFFNAPSPPSGAYRLDGLTPGASYSVAISSIDHGGFSQPVISPLPGPDEFYNGANESNDSDHDVPTDVVPVVPPAGGAVEGIDIILNAPSSARILTDPNSLTPPDDSQVSGFAVPPEIDVRRVDARFLDQDGNGSQETLVVRVDVVGPLGANNSEFRFQIDFGEPQRVGRQLLSLEDQTVEPGTKGIPTADVTLRVTFDAQGSHFSGLPGLADRSGVDPTAGQIVFVASVDEILAQATQEQLGAANNFDGTFTVLGFTSAALRKFVDRVPDTNDNANPSIVQETSRFTFTPFAVRPTHLGSVPNGTLIAVEESTARAIRIGNIGVASFSDLALSSDGRLFGSLGFGGGGRIVRIDPATAQRTDVGFSGFSAVPALDFGPPGTPFAGTLFGTGALGAPGSDPNYFLITINPSTGQGTPIGRIGVPYVDSIVFTNDGRLFGAGFVSGDGVLAQIDPFTGAGRVIGPIGFTVSGLEVAGDGSLLGSLGGVEPQAGGLIRIDPATGRGTFIGLTGFSPVSGLTKLP